MSKEESFEEWFKKNKSPAAFSPYGKEMEEMTSWQAWNHQQTKLDKLESENKQLKEELQNVTCTNVFHQEAGIVCHKTIIINDLKEALKEAVEVINESETLEWALMTLEDRLTFGMSEEQAYKRREKRVMGVLRDTISCYQKFLKSEQYKKVEESL